MCRINAIIIIIVLFNYNVCLEYIRFPIIYFIILYYILYTCSRETYNALTNWLTDARTLASPNIVIVLVGNKKDLEAEREVTFLEASRFAQENGELYFTLLVNHACKKNMLLIHFFF